RWPSPREKSSCAGEVRRDRRQARPDRQGAGDALGIARDRERGRAPSRRRFLRRLLGEVLSPRPRRPLDRAHARALRLEPLLLFGERVIAEGEQRGGNQTREPLAGSLSTGTRSQGYSKGKLRGGNHSGSEGRWRRSNHYAPGSSGE